MPSKIISRDFYNRPVLQVARELLGMRLVRNLDSQRISGLILETEAYDGVDDLACHASVGRTKRNAVMFGPPGHAYVYFTYGMHWCLNCVTGHEGYAAAVLMRSILPLEGLDIITQQRSPAREKDWCNGPAKLTKALCIDGKLNGIDICRNRSSIYIEQARAIPAEFIQTAPRVGISSVPEPWRSKPWRFKAVLPLDWR